MSISKWLVSVVLAYLLVSVGPASAQDTTARDPAALARRLGGFQGETPIPLPPPLVETGDRATFLVTRAGEEQPTRADFVLAGESESIYLWVENGLDYDATAMRQMASQLDLIFTVMRLKDNLGGVNIIPETADEAAQRSQLYLPDVDNDAHLYILFAQGLEGNRSVYFNPADSLPAAYAPGGMSSERETLTLNTSELPGVPLHDGVYIGLLMRSYYTMLMYYNLPGQAVWLRDALSWYSLYSIQERLLTLDDIRPFLQSPDTPLTRLTTLGSSGAETGAGQLFLRYFIQQVGFGVFRDLFQQPGAGLGAIDAVLAQRGIVDLVSGERVTARDMFADWAMANVVNLPMGDGRYQYNALDAMQGQAAPATVIEDQFEFGLNEGLVNQLGTNYLALTSTQPVRFTVSFTGAPAAARLPMPGDSANRFYYSEGGVNQHTWLEHTFDLTRASSAALTFDTWYSMVEGWNYAYVTASADGGASWDILPATSSVYSNPYGLSYGAAFTGISNPEKPRPFPFMGVGLGADGLTINEIFPDGPASESDLLAGDVIAGHDGAVWSGQANLLSYLANYQPGDTIMLYVQRGTTFTDIPITLGAHPTRRYRPDALWQTERVDLSAYAGQRVMVRFEVVSAAESPDQGFAIDNIHVDAIGFADDAEGAVPGWTLNGWQQISNQTPQQFVVQSALLKADPAGNTVRRLIGAGENTSGTWEFQLEPQEIFVLAVSGVNDDTDVPARFSLSVSQAE